MTELLDGKTTVGVKHKFGDELIIERTRNSIARILPNNLFPDKNIYRDESSLQRTRRSKPSRRM
ncbi:MAG: hypothetical protein U5N85_16465 [Arcicella sp.]|nr:hypothetical protein [Arcicella sp.]